MTTKKFKTKWELEEEDSRRYRQHQEDTFRRRLAKIAREGYKCTFDGCSSRFDNQYELTLHINEHNKECWSQLKCNQPKCGRKFKSKKEFTKHIEEHKMDAINKTKKNIRSTLIVNKCGILLDEFPREFRSNVGTQIPFKLLGYSSLMEMVEDMTDVVRIVQLNDGTPMLQAVPDERTKELAKEIQNQKLNNEGFNRQTGKVLRTLGYSDFEKLSSNVPQIRKAPEFLKRVIKDFLEEDEIGAEGVTFLEIQELLMERIGENIDVQEMGYHSMEDLFLNGLADLVDMKLEGNGWRIVPLGSIQKVDRESKLAKATVGLKTLQAKIKDVLENQNFEFGISLASLTQFYSSWFGPVNMDTVGCRDLLEVCLASPGVCRVDTGVDTSILPATSAVRHPHPTPVFPLYKLGEVKTRVKKILEEVGGQVPLTLTKFAQGYEGYYGARAVFELRCDNWLAVVKMMPDICTLSKHQGKYYISKKTNSSPRPEVVKSSTKVAKVNKIPMNLIINLHRVVAESSIGPSGDHGGVPYSQLYRRYLEATGDSLNVSQLGHSSLTGLLRSLHGSHGLWFDGSKLTSTVPVCVLPRLRPADLAPGWVRIVELERRDRCRVLAVPGGEDSWELELQLEEHYVTRARGTRLPEEEAVLGQTVAALYTDTRVYRATILSLPGAGVAKLFYVDQGWTAVARTEALFRLEDRFRVLSEQVVTLTTTAAILPDLESIEAVKEVIRGNSELGWLVREGGRVEVRVGLASVCEEHCKPGSQPSRPANINHALKNIALRKMCSVLLSG